MSGGATGLKYTFAFIGRILFAGFFLVMGLHTAFTFNAALQTLSGVHHGEVFLIVITILQLLGGVLVLIGWYTRLGAFLLLAAVVIMSWLQFLVFPESAVAGSIPTGEVALFTFLRVVDKLVFAGACLYIMAFGAGGFSIDYFRSRGKRLN